MYKLQTTRLSAGFLMTAMEALKARHRKHAGGPKLGDYSEFLTGFGEAAISG
jgi:hypothetical protein